MLRPVKVMRHFYWTLVRLNIWNKDLRSNELIDYIRRIKPQRENDEQDNER